MKTALQGTLILAALLVIVAWTGCKKKPPTKTKEEVILEKVEERFLLWKADLEKRCMEQAMDKAIAIVDSVIIADARQGRDTLWKPDIPGRPYRPEFTVPEDTIPIAPLLQFQPDTNQ